MKAILDNLRSLWLAEPIAVIKVGKAVYWALVAFGWVHNTLTEAQSGALLVLGEVITGGLARQNVVAPATLHSAGLNVSQVREVADMNIKAHAENPTPAVRIDLLHLADDGSAPVPVVTPVPHVAPNPQVLTTHKPPPYRPQIKA